MATRFELVLPGKVTPGLQAAAEEALDEIERIEGQLSYYRPTSEICALNREAGVRPVRVNLEVFRLLQLAVQLSAQTLGAFDITVAPLLRIWGFSGGASRIPSADQLSEAKSQVGCHHLLFNEENQTVRFTHPSVQIDLGSIGKGYAIDCAAGILHDHEIHSALLHGGTSTVIAMGHGIDDQIWKVALPAPTGCSPREIKTVELHESALSFSACWGKSFTQEGKTFGHVIDPHTGEPTEAAQFAAVMHSSATITDALSTALLVRGSSFLPHLQSHYPNLRAWVG